MTTRTPFCDTARTLMQQQRLDYIALSVICDRARSHTWWKNLLEYGPWKGPNGARVAPPGPKEFPGIANLFGTTVEQVAEMVAADWYGVHRDAPLSARALRVLPALDALDDADAARIEDLIGRLREAAELRAIIEAAERGEREVTGYSSREEAHRDLGLHTLSPEEVAAYADVMNDGPR